VPDAARPFRSIGSLLPGVFYDLAGATARTDRTALGNLVATAVEEHLLWGAIRLTRHGNTHDGERVRGERTRSFVSEDRFDSAFASRDELIARVELAARLPFTAADLAVTLIEFRIDTHLVHAEPVSLPGVLIRPTDDERFTDRDVYFFTQKALQDELYRSDRWLKALRRSRRLARLSLILRTARLFQVPLRYQVQLFVAPDVARDPFTVAPWTDVSIESAASTAPRS
jgi:hypothetical protein